jgi:hypothetical protein
MKSKRNLDWLERKLEALRCFDGSLLGHVGSSPDVKQLAISFQHYSFCGR